MYRQGDGEMRAGEKELSIVGEITFVAFTRLMVN